jgi:hypothetical protein
MKLGYDITVASEKVKGLEELYDQKGVEISFCTDE